MADDTVETGLKVGQFVTGLAPLPGAQAASVAFEVPIAMMEENKRRAELSQTLGRDSLEVAAANNPALKRQLESLSKKTENSIRNAVVSAGGSGLGMMVGGAAGVAATGAAVGAGALTFTIPIVGPIAATTVGGAVGGLVGAAAGGFAASELDSAIFSTNSDNAYAILANIESDLQEKIPVSEEKMFALLASSLPDENLKYIDNVLEKNSGGEIKTLEEAIVKGEVQEIQKLMRMPNIDEMIYADTGLMARFGENGAPIMSASAEFAAMVNNGMDPVRLMLKDQRLEVVNVMNDMSMGVNYAQGVDVSETSNPLPTMEQPIGHPTGRRDASNAHRHSGSGVPDNSGSRTV